MLQCSECEYFSEGPDGRPIFLCNPFRNIKEPECLDKWQVIKLDSMVRAYEATVQMYQRLAPMQERMFRHMERELDEAEEQDSWKYLDDEEHEGDAEQDDDGNNPPPLGFTS